VAAQGRAARLALLARPEAQPDQTAPVEQRDQLVRLLRELPPRQRAAIVLRYWEDLTEADAARLMGCSVGTVKAATSRGLRRLRELSEAAGVTATGFPDDQFPGHGIPGGGPPASAIRAGQRTAANIPQSPASTTGSAS
jgi:hypothetical protein